MSSSPDLMQRIARAGARMDPGLSNWDVERLVASARQRRHARRAGRVIFLAAAACVTFITLVVIAYRKFDGHRQELASSHSVTHGHAEGSSPTAPIVRLADGSTATPLDAATVITVAQDMTDRAELVLSRGRGRFDVKPTPTRTFVVRAGNVTVAVLGTLFTVERVADRVGVSVERGTVRVDWGIGSAVLEANNSGWYPPLVIKQDDHAATDEDSARGHSSRATASSSPPGATNPSVASKTESAADLLQASDNARISGHAEQAAELLRKLLREHRGDARAPLAAFTLGRMLLMELGRPGEAAHVFAEARRLAPGGPFAEDALAREVEAYSKAGVPAQARSKAEEYLRLYPEGRRAAVVRVMGGIK